MKTFKIVKQHVLFAIPYFAVIAVQLINQYVIYVLAIEMLLIIVIVPLKLNTILNK